MRVTTKAVFDIETGSLLERRSYEYEGSVEWAGGGPTGEQWKALYGLQGISDAAKGQMQKGIQTTNQAIGQAMPFYQQRAQTGLSFFPSLTDYTSGTNAQAFAPERAQILRDTSRYGTNMPSGYRDSLLGNLDAARARAFDSSLTGNLMMNEQAKQAGMQGVMGTAQMANPAQWASIGAGTNQAVMGADNMRPPNVWGTLGGLAMQGMKTAGDFASKTG